MIYLDNAATSKLNTQINQDYNYLLTKYFYNLDSPYMDALSIKGFQEEARHKLATLLNVKDQELLYVSSGSEANNMIIKGIAFSHLQSNNKHIITSSIEHASVYETLEQLRTTFGFTITYLDVNQYGCINQDQLLQAITSKTCLITIMKVNNETGAINNIEALYDQIKALNSKVIVHSDCVQALGKVNIDLSKLDCASFSAHKINGLKGSGLVYKKNKVYILPLISGGQQEQGLRAGTINYATNIMFSKTLRLYLEQLNLDLVYSINDYLYEQLSLLDVVINSNQKQCSPFIINFSLPHYQVETILNALESSKILVSTQSACSSRVKNSRVLMNLPIKSELKDSAIRISITNTTTLLEVQEFIKQLSIILQEMARSK
ncbi:MAG: cysteine desulfurase family protein [Bacilli bacterium]